MAQLHFKPGFELAAMVRRRELKPSELTAAMLARIDAVNPKLNAFCALRAEAAMAEARAMDKKIARGEEVGALAGLAVGVKDLEDVADLPTTFGSVPFKDHMAADDSVQVARLKAAGAIVVGKTNTPEFGYTAFTKNLLFGVTRNPWNFERTPGGSSGGSAAAVAGGLVPLATGSDAGGSIRIPACYTGCFGLKPSRGRIPHEPMFGMADFTAMGVLGPLTRAVRDGAIYLDAVAGYHPCDPDSLPHPGFSYEAVLERMPKKLIIAFHPDFGHVVATDVSREVEKAVAAFADMGHEIHVLTEAVPETSKAWMTLFACRDYALLHDYLERYPTQFGRAFLAGTQAAARIGWDAIAMAQRQRAEFNGWIASVFDRFDLLLTPTLPTEAFAAAGPPPRQIGAQALPDEMAALVFTYPFNLSGHPAASVRAGFTDSGLPCGLQIVAERYRDDLVLQAAYAYEQARPWNDKWPEV